MKHKIIFTMILICSVFGVRAQEDNGYKVLDLQTFKDSITEKKVQLIDVRTPEEYKDGHITDAKNIDLYSGKFADDFDLLDKDQPVYIYCRSGSRSKQAGNKLSEMGFKEIYDLKGGFLNYK